MRKSLMEEAEGSVEWQRYHAAFLLYQAGWHNFLKQRGIWLYSSNPRYYQWYISVHEKKYNDFKQQYDDFVEEAGCFK